MWVYFWKKVDKKNNNDDDVDDRGKKRKKRKRGMMVKIRVFQVSLDKYNYVPFSDQDLKVMVKPSVQRHYIYYYYPR